MFGFVADSGKNVPRHLALVRFFRQIERRRSNYTDVGSPGLKLGTHYTGVQNDVRVHGPCSRLVNTSSVYRARTWASFWTPVFRGRVYHQCIVGPFTRAV